MLNPRPNRELQLADYSGTAIPNSVGADPSPNAVALTRSALKSIIGQRQVLGQPTGRYNCFGLVLASRRTVIESPAVAEQVLANDCYSRVGTPTVGDIVAYRSGNGEIDHVGFVTRIELGAVFIWSKWGVLEEFEHHVHACPYTDCDVEYWRLT